MRDLAPVLWMAAAFVVVMPLAIILAGPFQVAPDVPQDPTGGNSLWFVLGAIAFVGLAIAMAVFVLWVLRTRRMRILRAIFLGAVGTALLFALARPITWAAARAPGIAVWASALGAIGMVLWRLWVAPTRGLTNAVGVVVAAAVAAVAGAMLGVTPVLFLLVFIAVYDVVAVKRTKHMVTLARGVTELNLPVALHFGVPDRPSPRPPQHATPVRTQPDDGQAADVASDTGSAPLAPGPGPPRAPLASTPPVARRRRPRGLTMGVGDLVFPSALVVAAADPSRTWGAAPAAACAAGVMVGYALLVWAAWKGEPQPGLPLLNGGAILGFFAGLVWATRSLRFW